MTLFCDSTSSNFTYMHVVEQDFLVFMVINFLNCEHQNSKIKINFFPFQFLSVSSTNILAWLQQSFSALVNINFLTHHNKVREFWSIFVTSILALIAVYHGRCKIAEFFLFISMLEAPNNHFFYAFENLLNMSTKNATCL